MLVAHQQDFDSPAWCSRYADAHQRLVAARDALSGIQADLARNDGESVKMAAVMRQIVDGVHAMESRLRRNHCSF